MPSSIEHNTRELAYLKRSVPKGRGVTDEEQQQQIADWSEDLTKWDARDVSEAVRWWRDTQDYWPKSWRAMRDAVDDAGVRRRQADTPKDAPPRAHENWVQRCYRLGFKADRLSGIGVGAWEPVLDRCKNPGMGDAELVQALSWCEAHQGRKWRPMSQPPAHADIRETCKLAEAIRAQPGMYLAGPALLNIGEFIIARNIVRGHAPPDVADWYRHLPAQFPELAEAVAAE